MTQKLPHVVVVGAGFGGVATIKALSKEPVKITLVDRTNIICFRHFYISFQQRYYQQMIYHFRYGPCSEK